MGPQTVWIGGKHPCAPPRKKPVKSVSNEEWLQLVWSAPGSTRSDLQARASSTVTDNMANHKLSRLEKNGLIRSEKVRRRVGTVGYFVMKLWFPVKTISQEQRNEHQRIVHQSGNRGHPYNPPAGDF
jgi:hypothetical protein